MSFSSDIKEELSKVNNLKNKEILEAEFLGYILTGNTTNNEDVLEFITENEFNIERFYRILFNLEIEYEPSIRGKVFVATINKTDKVENLMQIKIEQNDEIQRAIVKGAFLGAGSITDPNKQYHLEICFEEKNNAEYVLNICKRFGVYLKLLELENKVQLYIKDGEEISKFLALLGANKGVLSFEDVRITKEIKNNVNRLVNCETANLNKIVNASVNQVNDIKLIQNLNKFEELPDYLKEIALLRLENPDASLKVLGEMLENPIGKSGVNHRLQKIHDFAEELRQGK
ncbi:MAG: DNA-binding protein WhiA [Clostridia bacterium]|nr:DNA-binding protein WhiA [Clostridia bacterium]